MRAKCLRIPAVTALGIFVAALAGTSAQAAGAPAISGLYRANGKDAKLAYLVAVKHENFDGQAAVTLVLTEKEPKGEEHPDFGASFGHFGAALVVSILKDGTVFGCEIGHTALKRMGVSSVGKLETANFKWANGEVSGKLTTHGKTSIFDESWEADLDFHAKLP